MNKLIPNGNQDYQKAEFKAINVQWAFVLIAEPSADCPNQRGSVCIVLPSWTPDNKLALMQTLPPIHETWIPALAPCQAAVGTWRVSQYMGVLCVIA